MMFNKNNFIIVLLSISSCGWVACSQSSKESKNISQETSTAAKPAVTVPAGFQLQLDKTVKAYLSLKDAFVASDTTQTTAKAGDLLQALNQTDTTSLSPEAIQKWSTHKTTLVRSVETIKASQKLEEQRVQFEDVSKTMYTLVNDFGTQTTLYKQYCPMAFDDKGAYWLSAQNEIKNPYFGDAMLTCGEVQETLAFE